MLQLPEDQKRHLGVTQFQCPKCKSKERRSYCRDCEAFFFECNCKDNEDALQHAGHRLLTAEQAPCYPRSSER